MKPRTRVNHPPQTVFPAGRRALVSPIYQSVKFELEDLAATERVWSGREPGFHYSRVGNPTVSELEELLAELQGREACIATGSGIAAVALALIAFLSAGDHVVGFIETYGPTRALLSKTLGRFGVTHELVSLHDIAAVEHALSRVKTRVVWFESPTNPMLKIADVEAICRLSHDHGALVMLDNTLAGLEAHAQFPIDVYVHSLTKSANGHGDVMGGAIIASQQLIDQVRMQANVFGPALDPHAAFLILRGLRTYHIRRAAQCASAQKIAEWLALHPRVARVHYPGLESHPSHQLAREQMTDFGSVVTVDLKGDPEHSRRFADGLTLFSSVASLGSTESLIFPPQLQQPQGLTKDQGLLSSVLPTTSRLSIGLEDPDDLIADLETALTSAFAPNE